MPFLLRLEQSHIVRSYVPGGPRVPPPQDIKGSGKAEGGEPSLGQGTGLGSLVRGREPVLRGGTPSPGEMRGGGTGSQHLWVLIPGSGVRECLLPLPPHMLLGYSHLCPARPVLIGHGLGPALKSLGLVSPQPPSPLPPQMAFYIPVARSKPLCASAATSVK